MIDTQALAWFALNSLRLSGTARDAMLSDSEPILVSAVTAYEFADLNGRGRFKADLALDPLLRRLYAEVVDYPAACWQLAVSLPAVHRDPVDRMLIAHAIYLDAVLVSSDAHIRAYPVRWLW